jgi:hypothetical protein
VNFRIFFERCIAKKVCTACSRTSYKIVHLTNLNKYLHNGKSEIKLNVTEVKNSLQKTSTATVGELITAECASVVNVRISCTQQSDRLEYNCRLVGPGGWGGRGSEQDI